MRRRDVVLDRMLACGMITASQGEQALREPVGASWHELPQGARDDGSLPALLTLSGSNPDPHGMVAQMADLCEVDRDRLRLWVFARCVVEWLWFEVDGVVESLAP